MNADRPVALAGGPANLPVGALARRFGDHWRMACRRCRQEFPNDVTMGVVLAHTETEHGTSRIQLLLVWKGEGPAPDPEEVVP